MMKRQLGWEQSIQNTAILQAAEVVDEEAIPAILKGAIVLEWRWRSAAGPGR
jgi:hypothetical protein